MKIPEICKTAYREVHRPKLFILALIIAFLACALYPSDMEDYSRHLADTKAGQVENITEHYGRFVNTVLQVGLPIVLADKVGLVQLAYVAVSSTALTQGMKFLANDWRVNGTRLGQRPSNPRSKHNMPSGHSSMASCAMYFVCRRYSFWYALLLIPIMLLTMYTRVMLHDHTVSAVLAGAIAGILSGAIFTSRWRRGRRPDASRPGNAAAKSALHH